MHHLRQIIADGVSDLREVSVGFALIGGLAVSARAEPRTTRDVDLAVAAASDEEAEQVVFDLQQRDYSLIQTVEQTGTGRLATARLRPPSSAEGGALLDLLFASSGIEAEIISGATPIEILDGVVVPVAQLGHLIALKLLSFDDRERPQDRMDLNALRREAIETDLATAREAAALITERGFHRGRDLLALFDEILEPQ